MTYASVAAAVLLAVTEVSGQPPVASLPLTVRGNSAHLAAEVNGQRTLLLLFDTAAGVHSINQTRAAGAGDGTSRAVRIANLILRAGSLRLPSDPALPWNSIRWRRGAAIPWRA